MVQREGLRLTNLEQGKTCADTHKHSFDDKAADQVQALWHTVLDPECSSAWGSFMSMVGGRVL